MQNKLNNILFNVLIIYKKITAFNSIKKKGY